MGLGLTDRFKPRNHFLQHPAAAACSTVSRGAAAKKQTVRALNATADFCPGATHPGKPQLEKSDL